MKTFPRMAPIEQSFPRPCVEDVEARSFQIVQTSLGQRQLSSKRIAIAVGSRGIENIDKIVRAAVAALKQCGAEAFLVPAMGSHGGGQAEAQKKILLEYKLTPDNVGAEILSSMETVQLGETPSGLPVYMDRNAYESDGVILINRVKPHTDFTGVVESGLMKMTAIGLGKIDGASAFHSRTSEFESDQMIRDIAQTALQNGKILGGLAIIENAYHETAHLEWTAPDAMDANEQQWLKRAKEWMPSLPVAQADCLIVDRIGKNISGVGLDPNITGRRYKINRRWNTTPDITRIILLGLTEETNGNAVGCGLADFCSQRLLDAMNKNVTYVNAVTSRNVICADIPPHWDTDEETLQWAFKSVGNPDLSQLRVLRIRDTLSLTHIEASEALLDEFKQSPQVAQIGGLREMTFDSTGALAPLA
ncbi:MAG: lactate racemase domain-containing protein [Candidatus Hinthialibacter antarcticus]|nr:lactate racemase domain-containing protein [Candidatus Hinthialibacter antarcticus]